MSVYNFANSVVAGSAGQSTGFYPKTIEGSLRFNDDDSAYLSWTPASAGNRKTWTWSGWVKRGNLGVNGNIFTSLYSGSDNFLFRFLSGDTLQIVNTISSTQTLNLTPSQLFRDTSAWYHIVLSIDTTQATASDRASLYINGTEVTAFATSTYPSQNSDLQINQANEHNLGNLSGAAQYLDGYLAEVHFIDGTAYDADAFGEFKEGVWVAKAPSVTYGTNGFHLTFQDDTEVEAFNTVLYRGTGSEQSITGMGFQPDLVWIKNRDQPDDHVLTDAIRGAGFRLESNTSDAESTFASGDLVSFDSDGFTVGGFQRVNANTESLVAWGWKAGDSNVSNTDGTITSTVRANDTYGFSIVSYTGNNTAGATVGHGLDSAPDMILMKSRDSGNKWRVYHSTLGATKNLSLNQTSGEEDNAGVFDDTEPTSSVFTLGDNASVNNTDDFIAYCWAEKSGYSKFGSYSGGTSGYKITTGFKPAFVLIKRTNSDTSWFIIDNTRDTDGIAGKRLKADGSDTESDLGTSGLTIVSDGFEIENTFDGWNASGGTYIYAAFADTREAAFWLDQSGNDNDWQPVNLDHNDTVADSPTDNFATLNPLTLSETSVTYSEGNLEANTASGNMQVLPTIPFTGQNYIEVTDLTGNGSIVFSTDTNVGNTMYFSLATEGRIYNTGGTKEDKGVTFTVNSGSLFSWTTNDVIGIAYDVSTHTMILTKNGGSDVNITVNGVSGDYIFPLFVNYSSGSATGYLANFGQQPFKYDPPE